MGWDSSGLILSPRPPLSRAPGGSWPCWSMRPTQPRWDAQFGSERALVAWREQPHSATAVMREINGYYRLLERGWMTTEVTYFFNDTGRIERLLIRGVGERPLGRTEEFQAWFRRLLHQWRQATGLPAK